MTGQSVPLLKALSRYRHIIARNPRYVAMRTVARFGFARSLVANLRAIRFFSETRRFSVDCERRLSESEFAGIDPKELSETLRNDGVAFGLKLSESTRAAVYRYALDNRCFADRQPAQGFLLEQRAEAERALGKPILLAQYLNTVTGCPEIAKLIRDPVLNAIACDFLGSKPTFVGANLWWTFPVEASEEDRDRHAHLFHRDIDDFRFLKFFFYISDVESGDGPHVMVKASHRKVPGRNIVDKCFIRRYTDEEIESQYGKDAITEIYGRAGSGFVENTLCVHKGLTPTRNMRLLLQCQYALFDYGFMHDDVSPSDMQSLV